VQNARVANTLARQLESGLGCASYVVMANCRDLGMSTLWDGEELTEFPSSAREHLRPMNAFDPTRPALVYDEMNDQFLKWRPEWAESYREETKELDHRGPWLAAAAQYFP
jgi:hypothetical protein